MAGIKKTHQREGGKAMGLRALQKAGCQVPPFMVLNTGVFAKGTNHTTRHLDPDWHSPETEKKIDRWLQSLSGDVWPLAVRSSAVGEDGAQHAYPGMLDTALHVNCRTALTKAIHRVASSIWSERVETYQREKKIVQKLLPAVIIQKEIAAEFSGVMFTTHPPYPNELMIHLVEGYGDELVSGQADPIEVIFDKATRRLVGEERALPLPEVDLLKALFETGTTLEETQEAPQDIEFCIADGKVFYLQMRPITTPPATQRLLDNSNIQESYCGATTELTYSFACKAYETVYTQTMCALGLPPKTIEVNREVTANLLEKYRGNIYYNINNWYRGLQLLPAFRQNKADMERMMGLEEPVNFVESRRESLWEIIVKLPGLILNMARLLLAFRRLKKDTRVFQREFKSQFELFYTSNPGNFTLNDCGEWFKTLNEKLLQRWHVPIVNDFYVMMQNGKVHRQLKKSGVENPDSKLQAQLIGDRSLPSLLPAIKLQELGKTLSGNPKLVELVNQFPPDLHQKIAKSFPETFASIREYIHEYGDRTIGELKLETTTMRVDPGIFYKYLQNYMHGDQQIDMRASTSEIDKINIPNLKKLREGIHRREALRLERTRLFGMYRSLFLRIGELLTDEGKLIKRSDIFHFTLEEVEALLHGDVCPSDEKIEARKTELKKWQDAKIPTRIYIPGREPQIKSGELPDGSWQGEAAVSGIAEGEVVCIREPRDWADLRGKIICALRTDPGWAPLFPGCRGVIIEKGSSLSHSVIMLRELGIPTIINLPGISHTLESGRNVKMDANSGKIEILQ
ncbi:MAG: PEP/pyruvate-binding domain-containing protein [Cryomorphaceae bacterium]